MWGNKQILKYFGESRHFYHHGSFNCTLFLDSIVLLISEEKECAVAYDGRETYNEQHELLTTTTLKLSLM